MPILQSDPNNNIWTLNQLPKLDDNPRVWIIRYTNELFVDYQEYLQRIDFYRLRQWKCSATGKIGLTYEEALCSERKSNSHLDNFPDELIELLARKVHHCTLPLKQLVDEIYVSFVAWQENVHDALAQNTTGRKRKSISIRSQSQRAPISKEAIRIKIKHIASRDAYHNAPWLVSDHLISKFGLKRNLPYALQRIRDDFYASFEANQPPKKETVFHIRTPEQPPLPYSLISEWPNTSYGDILMSWDFLNRFSKCIRLTSFPLTIYEKALQDPSPFGIVDDIHISLLKLLRTDEIIVELKEKEKSRQNQSIHEDNESLFAEKISQALASDKQLKSISISNWTQLLFDYFIRQKVQVSDEVSIKLTHRSEYVLLSLADRVSIIQLVCDFAANTNSVRAFIESRLQLLTQLRHERSEHLAEERKARIQEKKKAEEERIKLEEERKLAELSLPMQLIQGTFTLNSLSESQQRPKIDLDKRISEFEEQRTKRLNQLEEFERHHEATEALYSVRMNPLGQDRNRRKYYWSENNGGRIFIQEGNVDNWTFYADVKQLDGLIKYISPNVNQLESDLKKSLLQVYKQISLSMSHNLQTKVLPVRVTRSSYTSK